MKKYVYVRRLKDGQLLDIPEEQLEMTLKRGGFEEIKNTGEVFENSMVEFKPNPEKFECPICGKEFKNNLGLMGHKRSHK